MSDLTLSLDDGRLVVRKDSLTAVYYGKTIRGNTDHSEVYVHYHGGPPNGNRITRNARMTFETVSAIIEANAARDAALRQREEALIDRAGQTPQQPPRLIFASGAEVLAAAIVGVSTVVTGRIHHIGVAEAACYVEVLLGGGGVLKIPCGEDAVKTYKNVVAEAWRTALVSGTDQVVPAVA